MSNRLADFIDETNKILNITAYVGENWKRNIQFTIDDEYVCLTEEQTKNLLTLLKNNNTKIAVPIKEGTGSFMIFWDKVNYRFDIGTKSIYLTPFQIDVLLRILQCRLENRKGFRATDSDLELQVHPDYTELPINKSEFEDQLIKFIHQNNIPFIEANIIRCICYHRKNNGIEDLRKAKHYLEILAEFEYREKL